VHITWQSYIIDIAKNMFGNDCGGEDKGGREGILGKMKNSDKTSEPSWDIPYHIDALDENDEELKDSDGKYLARLVRGVHMGRTMFELPMHLANAYTEQRYETYGWDIPRKLIKELDMIYKKYKNEF